MLIQRIGGFCQPGAVFGRAQISDAAKNLALLRGGLPGGLISHAATRTGTSSGWQFSTQAVCSAVSRAGVNSRSILDRAILA